MKKRIKIDFSDDKTFAKINFLINILVGNKF